MFKNSVLAHERLAIVDVEHGSQPLRNAQGNVALAVNGEVSTSAEGADMGPTRTEV